MRDWLRLVRIHNLLLAAAGVVAGGWIALARVALPRDLVLAALSAAALGAAANALNDVHDVAADRVNRPDRPLAAGRLAVGAAHATIAGGAILGLATAGLVSGALIAVAVTALVVMAAYSPLLKPAGVPGNLAVAAVGGLPLPYGALAAGAPLAGVVPWVLAAWVHLARELVKDVEDEAGDRAIGRRTLPARIGRADSLRAAAVLALAFVPVSVLLPGVTGYRWPYFAVAVPAWIALAAVARDLAAGRSAGAGTMLKVVMAVGLVALVAGRIA